MSSMRDTQPNYFVGLDVGTSLVRCVVGNLDLASEEPRMSVIGYGSAPNLGMRKGLVVHLEDVASAVNQAVSEAERIAGVPIRTATVNVNGLHISGLDSKGVIAISAANREISLDDKLRVEDAATIVQIPANREIIQVFPKNYRVDGHDSIKDPIGMRGVRLEVDTHIVTVATPNIRSLDAALEKAHITASHHTVAGLAAAEAVLNRQQKEAGTLVLDIGASTTNLAVIEDGEVQHVAVIPMGGIHITNDLAIGLKTDLEIAEMVKLQHAALAGAGKSGRLSVQYEKVNHAFDADDIHMVVEARVDELFDYIEKELKRIHKSRRLPGGTVLVGGTANIPGIAAFARDKLQLASRLGNMNSLEGIIDDIKKPEYVTAVGLMQLDMLFSEQLSNQSNSGGGTSGLVDTLGGLFRKLR
ncbi:MAG: cell division protein FtsA [Candidatus Saccharimonadales bacterium]